MTSRFFITTTLIAMIAVGMALVLTPSAGALDTLLDAAAITILVTVMSLQVWLRERIFRPGAKPARPRPIFRAYTRGPRHTGRIASASGSWAAGHAAR